MIFWSSMIVCKPLFANVCLFSNKHIGAAKIMPSDKALPLYLQLFFLIYLTQAHAILVYGVHINCHSVIP